MKIHRLDIEGVIMMVPQKHQDSRGLFSETYNQKAFDAACGATSFVQDNHALSAAKGTLRGLHFQAPPKAQAKLVLVMKGAIYDVAVDLRAGSPTYGRHVGVTLSQQNWAQLFVPKGFAHGYVTLEPETEVFYKVDEFYSPEHDKGLIWNDPDLAIAWPVEGGPILSDKDAGLPRLKELPKYFG